MNGQFEKYYRITKLQCSRQRGKKAKNNISFADIYFYDLTNIKMINTKKKSRCIWEKVNGHSICHWLFWLAIGILTQTTSLKSTYESSSRQTNNLIITEHNMATHHYRQSIVLCATLHFAQSIYDRFYDTI